VEKSIIELLKKLLKAIFAPSFSQVDYVWPLSNCTTPDEMNTSFGPRINKDQWDFHDGIDLPAAIGTNVHAMRAGTVHLAGEKNDRFSSRHVILKVGDPNDGLLYLVYLHLDSIDDAITLGASVTQGQVIGAGRFQDNDPRRCCQTDNLSLNFLGMPIFWPKTVSPISISPLIRVCTQPNATALQVTSYFAHSRAMVLVSAMMPALAAL